MKPAEEMTDAELSVAAAKAEVKLDAMIAVVEKILRASKKPMTVAEVRAAYKVAAGKSLPVWDAEYAVEFLEHWSGAKKVVSTAWVIK